jgi:hypothetical protein
MPNKQFAALFVRNDSAYKNRPSFDSWDADRDANNFKDDLPVVCHPPCRAWGRLSHMATNVREGEKELAFLSIDIVRKNGGILEHPSGSRLFSKYIPDADAFPDEFGGFTVLIDQYDFGHVAHKPTKLYFCGIDKMQLPKMPKASDIIADEDRPPLRSMTGQVKGTIRATQYEREYTPDALIDYFESVLHIIAENKRGKNAKSE